MGSNKNIYFFRRKGVIFIPIHFMGWLFLASLVGIAVYAFFRINAETPEISDTLINFAMYLLILVLGYMFFGFFTSKPGEKEKGY